MEYPRLKAHSFYSFPVGPFFCGPSPVGHHPIRGEPTSSHSWGKALPKEPEALAKAKWPDEPHRELLRAVVEDWKKQQHMRLFEFDDNALTLNFLIKSQFTKHEQLVFYTNK